MKMVLFSSVFAFLLFASVSWVPVYAQGLVPCGGTGQDPCQACHVIQLGNNVLSWGIKIMVSIIVLIFAWGGMKMVMSAGNTDGVSEAKGMMTNAVIGFVILLAAWLIVDTIMKLVVKEKFAVNGVELGMWNEVKCMTPPMGTPSATTSAKPGTVAPLPTAGCTTCATIPKSIPTNGNACSGGSVCQMRPEIVERLTNVNLMNEGLQVSEAWPPAGYTPSNPKGIHSATCHGNATCIDVSYTDRNSTPTAQQINGDIMSFKNNNLKAVYEVPNDSRRTELMQAGVTNVITVPGINREHFSVYACDLDSSAKACSKI